MEELSCADAGLRGRPVAVQPALMLVGIMLGVIIGVLPGLGGANGVAILLPLTFTMAPTSAIIMLSCIYWGALFGGAITSILFNIPGEPWSVATTFDGYPLAQKGRAGAGADRGVHLVVRRRAGRGDDDHLPRAAGREVRAASSAPPEFFAVYLLTFCSFVGMGKGSPFKTMASMMLGFALAAVGMDTVTGQLRLTFGFDRAAARLRLPDRGDRPVRHRRDPAHDGGRPRVQGQAARKINTKVVLETWKELPRYWVTSLRSAAGRLLDGHHAGRRDAGVVHELRPGEEDVARTAPSSAPARSKAWSRRRPRRTPPAPARCCRC